MSAIASQMTCAIPAGDFCGEGLVWSDEFGCLFWTDINRFLVHRHVPGSCDLSTWTFDEPVCALALTDDPNALLVALGSRLIFWNPKTDTRRDQGFYLEGAPDFRLNDGRADPLGRFWVGSMKSNVNADGTPGAVAPGMGKLFSVSGDRAAVLADGIGVPNTLCWSPDLSTFYFADTIENRIRAYDYDPATGSISNERSFFEGFARGLPDGSAVDAEGFLWNCRYGGGCIVRISPAGEIDAVVEVPVDNVTTCAFGGAGRRTLYVTSAASENGFQRLAGSLFSVQTNVAGGEEFRVRRMQEMTRGGAQ